MKTRFFALLVWLGLCGLLLIPLPWLGADEPTKTKTDDPKKDDEKPKDKPAAPAKKAVPLPKTEVLVKSLTARHIGTAVAGGRICDVTVVAQKPTTMYVASASGGVWKTVNNGTTWKPVFVSPSNPEVVWVGTGEANPRNSVTWGDGVYKSTNGGETWQHMGLKDTHHIGRIVIHPKDPNIVYVAALGHIWGPNSERGVFKTTDGGKTWNHTLNLGPDCGCIDVAIDPKEPETLWACAYTTRRDGFSGGNPATQFGPKAGLYKTTDGGKNWKRLTKGLPTCAYGRRDSDGKDEHPHCRRSTTAAKRRNGNRRHLPLR
jgi:photosystem II stability/assembly factor-like uncharacterized protein